MDLMDAHYTQYLGLALFVASELIGMSRLRSNSLLQLVLAAAIRAFPYRTRTPDAPARTLDVPLGIKNQDRR